MNVKVLKVTKSTVRSVGISY